MRAAVFWTVTGGLLALGTPLTVLRLLEPAAGWAVRLVSYTPLGLAAYAVLLVLLVVPLARRRRPAHLVVAGLALAGLGLHGWWSAPLVTGANPPAPPGADTRRVMTANLHDGTADGIELVRQVSREDVDLLVVQEVTAPLLATMEQAGLDAVLPHRVGDPGVRAEGTMVFSRGPLGTPAPLRTTADGWQVEADGLTLLAVHPASPYDVGAWRADHAALLAAVRETSPDLVVGDLNATVDHGPVRRLADVGYRSTTELGNDGWQPTWPAFGAAEVLGVPLPHLAQVDHVLAGRSLAVVGTGTLGIDGSDHRAVLAEVAVK